MYHGARWGVWAIAFVRWVIWSLGSCWESIFRPLRMRFLSKHTYWWGYGVQIFDISGKVTILIFPAVLYSVLLGSLNGIMQRSIYFHTSPRSTPFSSPIRAPPDPTSLGKPPLSTDPVLDNIHPSLDKPRNPPPTN